MSIQKRLEAYKNADAINQSLLVALSRGVGSYREEKNKFSKKPHFEEGTLYECLLTYPEEFNDLFCIIDESPSNTSAGIVRNVFDMVQTSFLDFPDWDSDSLDPLILSACTQLQYGGNTWTDERKLADIRKKGEQYYNSLCSCNGRIDMSHEQYDKVKSMVFVTLTSSHTNDIFQQKEDIDVRIQQPYVFEYRGHTCKALLDMVEINHKEKWVQPWDIKTIGDSVKAFPKSARQRRYDVQAMWYTLALSTAFPEYEIRRFNFLVCSTSTFEEPLIYTQSMLDDSIALYGGHWTYGPFGKRLAANENEYGEVDVEGIKQMLDRYEEHLYHQQWEKDMNIYLTNGQLETNYWK